MLDPQPQVRPTHHKAPRGLESIALGWSTQDALVSPGISDVPESPGTLCLCSSWAMGSFPPKWVCRDEAGSLMCPLLLLAPQDPPIPIFLRHPRGPGHGSSQAPAPPSRIPGELSPACVVPPHFLTILPDPGHQWQLSVSAPLKSVAPSCRHLCSQGISLKAMSLGTHSVLDVDTRSNSSPCHCRPR